MNSEQRVHETLSELKVARSKLDKAVYDQAAERILDAMRRMAESPAAVGPVMLHLAGSPVRNSDKYPDVGNPDVRQLTTIADMLTASVNRFLKEEAK